MKFKVGDTVNIKKSEHTGVAKHLFPDRFNIEIERYEPEVGSGYYLNKNGRSGWLLESRLELAQQKEEKEMSNFKAGDIVDLTEQGIKEYGWYFEDNIYEGLTIKEIDGKAADVKENTNNRSWYVPLYLLKLSEISDDDPSTWKRNTPIVITRNSESIRRHFCHYDANKKRVYFYPSGKTSFSFDEEVRQSNIWEKLDVVRKATKEELK